MIVLRILGFIGLFVGILFSITIIGAFIGVPIIFISLLFIVVSLLGRKRQPIIVQVNQQPPPTP